jgi:hypothetical protein
METAAVAEADKYPDFVLRKRLKNVYNNSQMNWVDIVVIILLILSFIGGLKKEW